MSNGRGRIASGCWAINLSRIGFDQSHDVAPHLARRVDHNPVLGRGQLNVDAHLGAQQLLQKIGLAGCQILAMGGEEKRKRE